MVVKAIFENGVFRPLEHVALPEHARVLATEEPRDSLPEISDEDMKAIYEIMGRRFDDPNSPGNLAERHNEHQP